MLKHGRHVLVVEVDEVTMEVEKLSYARACTSCIFNVDTQKTGTACSR